MLRLVQRIRKQTMSLSSSDYITVPCEPGKRKRDTAQDGGVEPDPPGQKTTPEPGDNKQEDETSARQPPRAPEARDPGDVGGSDSNRARPALGQLPPRDACGTIRKLGPPKMLFLRDDTQSCEDDDAGYRTLFQSSSLKLLQDRRVTAPGLLQACGIDNPTKLFLIVDMLSDVCVFSQMCSTVQEKFLVVSAHGFGGKGGQALLKSIQGRVPYALVADHELSPSPDDEHGHHLHMKSAVFWTPTGKWSVWGSANWTYFAFNRNAEFLIVEGDRAASVELLALAKYFAVLSQNSPDDQSWLRDPSKPLSLADLEHSRGLDLPRPTTKDLIHCYRRPRSRRRTIGPRARARIGGGACTKPTRSFMPSSSVTRRWCSSAFLAS
jgi:hypothetical protein